MNTEYVHSSLAADPDLGELVDVFAVEMPDRINTLETQGRSRNWEQLTRTAHQLKGAAGSYGFGQITPYASRLEIVARDGRPETEILAALSELLDICRRVRPGAPAEEDEQCPKRAERISVKQESQ